jgi:hypothetical protein
MSHGYATNGRRDVWRTVIAALVVVAGTFVGVVPAARAEAPAVDAEAASGTSSPAADLQQVRESFLALQRDLVILEEDLLFPASSQVAVFLSMDVGEFFALDAVTLTMDGDDVTHHLYTKRQVDALFRGGVQKLWLGNVKQGEHRLTAVFTGRGPEGRAYRRATTVTFEKTFEPALVELAIRDSTAKYQPEFFAVVDQ